MPSSAFILATVLCFALHGLSLASTSCGFGQFLQNGRCEDCPPGTFQDEEGSTECKPCLPGTYNPYHGAQGIDVCIECPEGTFQNRSRATSRSDCVSCPAGTNSSPGSPSCISCPAGQVIENCENSMLNADFKFSFRGNCFDCFGFASGFGCNLPRSPNPHCEDCPAGTFSGPNEVQCQRCPEETFSTERSSNCSSVQCPPGTERTFFGECQQCTEFTVFDESDSSCKECPPGYIGDSPEGSTRCVPCPAGTFKSPDSSTCRPCPSGENSFVTGAIFCVPDNTPCPPNYFRNSNGACLRCSKRQRFDREQGKCVDCPRNSMSEGGLAERCVQCPRNMITSDEFPYFELPCVCRPGFGFVPGSGGSSCMKCPVGTKGAGNSYCQKCYRNSIAPRRGMRRCIPCPEGMIQPRRGQRRCIPEPPCPSGTIRSADRCVEPQTNCPVNTTRVTLSLYEFPLCNAETCPAGVALIREEDFLVPDRCGVCDVDQRYDPVTSKCERCGSRQFSPGGLVQRCENCPRGFSTDGTPGECSCTGAKRIVNGRCSKCRRGTFGFNGLDGCRPCPAGTFSGRGWTHCENCIAGSFNDEPGQRSCRPCPEGTTSLGVGDTGCVEIGSFSES